MLGVILGVTLGSIDASDETGASEAEDSGESDEDGSIDELGCTGSIDDDVIVPSDEEAIGTFELDTSGGAGESDEDGDTADDEDANPVGEQQANVTAYSGYEPSKLV